MEKSIRKMEDRLRSKAIERELLYSGVPGCELGRVHWVGESRLTAQAGARSHFTPRWISRSCALLFLRRGAGRYHGMGPQPLPLASGSLFFLFPGLPFRYEVDRRKTWVENFVVFSGPFYDMWRENGLLDPQRPVWNPCAGMDWSAKIKSLAEPDEQRTVPPLLVLARLMALLAQAYNSQLETQKPGDFEAAWLRTSKSMLEDHERHSYPLGEIARHAGMTYDAFRKQFLRHTGITPGRYRLEKRLEAARELLEHTPLSIKEIAVSQGFSNSYHFSDCFLKFTGERPSEFRRRKMAQAAD